MNIKATKSGMKGVSIKALENHIIETDAKYSKAPKFIKRTSFARWVSNRAAILRELESRA